MAGGRQERTGRPVEEGGLHLQGRNAVEDPGFGRGCSTLRRAYRAATPTRQIDAGGVRHRARAMSTKPDSVRRGSIQPIEPPSEIVTPKSRDASRLGGALCAIELAPAQRGTASASS